MYYLLRPLLAMLAADAILRGLGVSSDLFSVTFQFTVFLLSITWVALIGCLIQTWSGMDAQARWFAVALRCSSVAERGAPAQLDVLRSEPSFHPEANANRQWFVASTMGILVFSAGRLLPELDSGFGIQHLIFLALSVALRPVADGVADECTRALARLYRREVWRSVIRAAFPMVRLTVKAPTDEMLVLGVRVLDRLRSEKEEDDLTHRAAGTAAPR